MTNLTPNQKLEIALSLNEYTTGNVKAYISKLGTKHSIIIVVYNDLDLDIVDSILSDWGFECTFQNRFNHRSGHIEDGVRFGFKLRF
tara:strand:+ start:119 stop:379 length:261 start_codon:yes stop_codon:yes gene_type:complete